MEKDKIKAFIIYIDDDENKGSMFATILNENISTITFKSNKGRPIKLPWHRILKIKYEDDYKGVGSDELQ